MIGIVKVALHRPLTFIVMAILIAIVGILSAARTPVGSFLGALSSLPASKLGEIAIKAALERAGVSGDEVDEVILGQILQAGEGQNPARQAAMKAGCPKETTAWALNQLCGSGLRAVALGRALDLPAAELEKGDGDPSAARIRDHVLWMDGREQAAVIYDRTKLRAGDVIPGPAIVCEMDSTTLIESGCVATVDHVGNILINLA